MPRNTSIGERIVPSLLVREMAETLDFYRSVLAFEVSGRYPDSGPLEWLEVRRDGVVLWFLAEAPRGLPDEPTLSGTIYLFPEGVVDLAEELGDRIEFEWGPEVMHYGMREFAIRDPNGYILAFAEPVSTDPD